MTSEEPKFEDFASSDSEMDEEFDSTDEPLGEERDLTGDGGVVKTLLENGSGWKKPNTGADVKVHYVGTLEDGTKFDSSRDRDAPFTFTLGKGQVIRGWDEVVKTMRKGEKCKVKLAPEYAYGESGSPPKIPANATLLFEIELIDWTQEEDISPAGDNGIRKTVKVSGSDWTNPKDLGTVTVDYRGILPDKTVFVEKKGEKFVVGDHEVVEGLEIAVKSMKKGEQSVVTMEPRFAFGEEGNTEAGVPPNTAVRYEITLVDFTNEKEAWELPTFEDKFEHAKSLKAAGNDFFKAGKADLAVKRYEKAISFIEHERDEQDKQRAQEVLLPCYLNVAACANRGKDYKEALRYCDRALKIDEASVKGLFRKGQALMHLQEYDDAEKSFLSCLEHDENNAEAKRFLALVRKQRRAQEEKDKKVFAKMFG